MADVLTPEELERFEEEIKKIAELVTAKKALEAQDKLSAIERRELLDITNKLTEAQTNLAEKTNKTVAEIKSLTDAVSSATREMRAKARAAEGLGKQLAGLIPIIGGNKDVLGSFGGQLAQAAKNAKGFGLGLSHVAGALKKKVTGQQLAANAMAASEELMAAMIASAVQLSTSIQSLNAEFNKATGAQGAFNDQMFTSFRATSQAGVSYAELANTTQALFTQTAKFTDMSKTTRASLIETTAVMGELGVDSGVSAQNLNIMTTSLNMNATQAEETSRRLLTAAEAMGVAPGAMASEFAAAGKQFASFGENAVDAFIDLREMAKKTGIELQSLLSITEKFTTFSGAAEHVGRLNAMLGGPFLNTIDMVNASLEDPAEAMLMVRDAIDAGLSFDEMSPAMRRAVAEAAGLEDAGQLASLMAGDLDSLGLASKKSAKDMEELKEATKITQSLAEELEATRVAFTLAFGPFIQDWIIPLLEHLQELAVFLDTNFGENGAATVAVMAGSLAMGIAFMGLMMTVASVAIPVVALTSSMGALTTALGAVAGTAPLAAKGIEGIGKAGVIGAPGMTAFGTAVLMVGAGLGAVGVGIGAAAAGISMLVDSLSDLSSSAKDFEKIGTTFNELNVPKMIAYTAAMSATALVGSTPAAAVIVAAGAAVGGTVAGGGEKEVIVDVNVDIKADPWKLFDIMDTRYAKRESITAGGAGRLPKYALGREGRSFSD